MAKNNNKKGKLKYKLTNKYRLVVLNESTFEERLSLKLSRLNIYIFGGVFSVTLILATILLIAFTPIKEYIPGYSSTKLQKDARRLTIDSDSLKNRLAILENYTNSIKSVLTGDLTSDDIIDSIQDSAKRIQIDESALGASKEDSIFREKIESRDRFPLSDESQEKLKIVFFAPISGNISQLFNSENKHFAIDVVAKNASTVSIQFGI